MFYLVVHRRPQIGALVGIDDNNGDRIFTTDERLNVIRVHALTLPQATEAVRLYSQFGDLVAVPCIPDWVADGNFYCGPAAVAMAAGGEYGWINEEVICYGNS